MQVKSIYVMSLASSIMLLTACGGGSSNHNNNPVSVTSSSMMLTNSSMATISSSSVTSSSSSGIVYTEPTTSLMLPPTLEIVTNESNLTAGADSGSDYTNDSQRYHVWNESLKPIELVNSILCLTGQFKANDFVNDGPYLALVDEKICFKEDSSGDEASQSAGAANVPTYMKVVVNATRGTGLSDPIIVNVWMPEMGNEEDGQQAIKFKAEIRKGASTANPFGSFTFNYSMLDSFTDNNSYGGGEIKTVDIENKIGFTFYENEIDGDRSSSKNASVVMSADRSNGIALTSNSRSGNDNGEGNNAFGLAFNASHVLLQTADTYDNLPFQPTSDNTGSESCLSRTEFDDSVMRYDIYSSSTGDRITLNSGLSFKYDSTPDNDDPSLNSYGHIGYWGVWTEKPNTLKNGAVIQVETPGSEETTEYTVIQSPGRLIKNTVNKLILAETRGVEFSYFSADAQESGYQSWIVKYLSPTNSNVEVSGFYKVAGNEQGGEGSSTVALDVPRLITVSDNQLLQMNSQQLGGNVKYKAGDTFLMFFKQEFVNGSEAELFASGSTKLYCVDRCPVGTLGATQLQSWDTPYSPRATSIENIIEFSISNIGDNALTLVRSSNSQAVKYVDVTEQALMNSHSPYSWGIRSGSLVTADVLASFTTINDFNNANVFYEWETGLNSFNQNTSIKNSAGVIQTFDKPIQIAYTHTDLTDRSGDAGDFNNKLIVLNYGGNGELWGIPSHQSDNGRTNSQFSIADGAIMGEDGEYKIKAREIESTMKDAAGQCSDLTLAEPAAPVPTGVTGNTDIGDMPVITSSPKVIGGVVQTSL